MATPTFCCGFECAAGHFNLLGTSSYSTTTIKSGLRALRTNPTAAQGNAYNDTVLSADNVVVGRFYINVVTAPESDSVLQGFGDASGSTHNLGLAYKSSDGKVYAGGFDSTGGVVWFGSTGVTLSAGWHRIDLKVNMSANPWLVDAQVDGTALGQASRAQAALTVSRINFGNSHGDTTLTMDIFHDDVLISETAADYPIGGGYVLSYVPDADGSHNVAGAADFKHGTAGADILNSTTDAWTLVDDRPLPTGTPSTTDLISLIAPPNATDYVKCTFENSSESAGPRTVEVIAAIHQAGTGTGNMEIRLDDGGTKNAVYSATTVAGTTAFKYVRKHYATKPSGGAWTDTAFDGLQVEFGSPAALDANPDQYFDAIMIEAEFAEVAAAAGPFALDDWPIPVGWNPASRWQQVFQGWIKGSQINLGVPERPPPGLSEGTRQSDWPNPTGLSDRYRVPAVLRDGWVWPTQLNLGVPQPVVQSPFFQDDWPNPVLSRFHIAYQGWTNPAVYPPPKPLPAALGQTDDQPVPLGWHPNFRWPAVLRDGYVQNRSPYFPLPQQLPDVLGQTDDQPNPIPRDFRVTYQGWTNKSAYWPPPLPLPEARGQTDDQPNPLPRDYRVAYQGHVWPTNPNLYPAVQFPFGQDDWPNPVLSKFHIAYQGWSNKSAYFPPPNQLPVGRGITDDQPNPIPRDYRTTYQGWVHSNRTLGIPVAFAGPFQDSDFPNPVGWSPAYQFPAVLRNGFTGAPGINLLLPPAVVSVPFAQHDWPNPIRRAWTAFIPPIQPESLPPTTITVVPSARIRAEQTEFPFAVLVRIDCIEVVDLNEQWAWRTYVGSTVFTSGVRVTQTTAEAIMAPTSVNGRVSQTVIEVITHS